MEVPEQLRQLRQWIVWRYEQRDGKPTKVPYQVNGSYAKTNDATTWTDFESAKAIADRFDGLGFVFTGTDPFFGVDLDGCRNPDTGELAEWAECILNEFPTYAEISPSGTGVKLFGRGKMPRDRGRKKNVDEPKVADKEPGIEAYDHGRYFAFTGQRWAVSPASVNDCQSPLDRLCDIYWPVAEKPQRSAAVLPLANGSHSDPIERATKYLQRVPPAISGQGGHNRTYRVACVLVLGFGLAPESAFPVLAQWNEACQPPWSDKELWHKLFDADKEDGPRGWLLADGRGYEGPDVDLRLFLESIESGLTELAINPETATGPKSPAEQEGQPASNHSVSQNSATFGNLAGIGNTISAISAISVSSGENDAPEQDGTPELNADEPQGPLEFPAECLEVPGLISSIIDYNLRTALYPQPELAFAAAIALVGTITGRKVTDEWGTRTNVYVLGLAPSGSGKEQGRKVNKEILLKAGGKPWLGPERIGSSAGMVSVLEQHPAMLFQLDEIGRLLTTMQNPGKSPHLYNVGTVMLQLYSSSDSLWIADAYADVKKIKQINQPHACIYGTSVPGAFWDSLTSENITEGLLGRLMTFEASQGYVPMRTPSRSEVPAEVLEHVSWWLEWSPGGRNQGNLSGLDHGSVAPQPMLAIYTDEARERMREHFEGICQRRLTETETTAAVWSRSGEKTAKLALIFACSRATPGVVPVVDLADVDRAVKVANWLTRKMLRKAFEHVAENETESRSKRVLREISRPMTITELTRKTRFLRGRERMEILSDLASAGYIVMDQKNTGGRPQTVVRRAV